MPDWKSPEAFKRLLAAMVAAQDMKLDYRKIATFYGEGATYDAIEGRFRLVKKDAQKLKAEIDSGDRAPAPARGTSSSANNDTTPKKPRGKKATANGTPTPKKDKVVSGRVGKAATPRKNVKAEALDDGAVDMMVGDMGDGSGNVVMGVKEEVVSSGSSFFGGEEDAVGEIVVGMGTGWDFGNLDI